MLLLESKLANLGDIIFFQLGVFIFYRGVVKIGFLLLRRSKDWIFIDLKNGMKKKIHT